MNFRLGCWVPLAAAMFFCSFCSKADETGVFEAETEIGTPALKGGLRLEEGGKRYIVSGGGANMWFTNDEFHFVWKKVTGDFMLSADISFLKEGGNPHRKACLMVRQSLEPDSPYVDVAVHGDGLTSFQFRERRGGLTHEIQSLKKMPLHIGIQKHGDVVIALLPPNGEKPSSDPGSLEIEGQYMRVGFATPVYVGLAVCAHDGGSLETARFDNVLLTQNAADFSGKPVLHCTLETITVASKDRRAIYHTTDHIEAPNWSRDGKSILFNAKGHIYRLPVAGGKPETVDTGFAIRCNNDHGLSPNGESLAISDQTRGGKSLIYLLPAAGGAPRQITTSGPSYWHGWSADGKTLAYCAERNGEFDVYTIPTSGGEETRLTNAKGLDDGPDFTADGKYIFFNSERSGSMQIWRMNADGTDQQQITSDEANNWFPHPSPDGKWLVFLSYGKDVQGHPDNQIVRLRLMPLGGGPIQDLAQLFGGQGTINVPSWSPDSKQLAFVSYELLPF